MAVAAATDCGCREHMTSAFSAQPNPDIFALHEGSLPLNSSQTRGRPENEEQRIKSNQSFSWYSIHATVSNSIRVLSTYHLLAWHDAISASGSEIAQAAEGCLLEGWLG